MPSTDNRRAEAAPSVTPDVVEAAKYLTLVSRAVGKVDGRFVIVLGVDRIVTRDDLGSLVDGRGEGAGAG